MNTAMSSTEIRNSGGRMNMELRGGRMNMQLGGWTEAPQEAKGSNDVGLITKGKDIMMPKMMPEAI